jgi:hypothetical protein
VPEAVLERLAGELRTTGGLLAAATRAPNGAAAPHGLLAARGPRAEGRQDDVALVVEAVREGYLLHYGEPEGDGRVVDASDPDFALLAGDRLYALGLARLADAGDLTSVAELSDVIALCAVAHAGQDADLADAVWDAGAVAVGWGACDALVQAKAAARAGAPGAAASLRAAARQLAGDLAPGS